MSQPPFWASVSVVACAIVAVPTASMAMLTNGRKYRSGPVFEMSANHHVDVSVMQSLAPRHSTPWAAPGLSEEVADPGFAAALFLSAV